MKNRNGDMFPCGVFSWEVQISFFFCGVSHVQSSLLSEFTLLFRSCRHAWTRARRATDRDLTDVIPDEKREVKHEKGEKL